MKTIFKYFIQLIILLSFNQIIAQEECTYDNNDITISLNGWDFDRTDYTHERFIEVAALGHNSQLDYSGEKDTEEFGYPWYYYYLGNNYIHFAGVMDSQGEYNGLKRINSFVIKDRGVFNVNGIQIGDTESALREAFSDINFCIDSISSRKKGLYFWYEYFALSFVISTNDNTILEIELYAPI